MMLLDLLVLCRSEEEFSEHDAEDEDDEGGVDVGSGQHLVLGTDLNRFLKTRLLEMKIVFDTQMIYDTNTNDSQQFLELLN